MVDKVKEIKRIASLCNNKRLGAHVTSVSRSGMSRNIHFVAVTKKGVVLNVTYTIAKILGLSYRDRDDSLHVRGCGMDMIFKCLYDLNSIGLFYGVVRKSKKHTRHDLQYNGIVNTSYNYL